LRQQRLTEIVDEPYHDAADERAEQAAGAAEDDHDKRERQHVLIDPWINREDGPADQAGETGKAGAESKYDREQLRDPDSDHPCHLRIVDPGADHSAKPGPL